MLEKDNIPPAIYCPQDIHVYTTDQTIAVSYEATVTDNIDIEPSLDYFPESGSDFPIGTTEVSVTAIDSSGNLSTCTFHVIVGHTVNPDLSDNENAPKTGCFISVLGEKSLSSYFYLVDLL